MASDGANLGDDDGVLAHELLPLGMEADESKLPKIYKIGLRRMRDPDPSGNEKGPQWDTVADKWRPSEITGWKQVHEMFGGGTYQAFGLTKGHKYARFGDITTLAGEPKSLVRGENVVPKPRAVVTVPAPVPPVPSVPAPNSDTQTALMLKMFELQMQMGSQNQTLMLKIFETMLRGKGDGGGSSIKEMGETLALLKNLRGGSDDVKSTLDLFKSFQGLQGNGNGNGQSDEIETILKTLLTRATSQQEPAPQTNSSKQPSGPNLVQVFFPGMGFVYVTPEQVAKMQQGGAPPWSGAPTSPGANGAPGASSGAPMPSGANGAPGASSGAPMPSGANGAPGASSGAPMPSGANGHEGPVFDPNNPMAGLIKMPGLAEALSDPDIPIPPELKATVLAGLSK